MTDSVPKLISVRVFRNTIKEILDGTQFLRCQYVITSFGEPVARVLPPGDAEGADGLTVTDVRNRTGEILEAIRRQNKTYIIIRHGRIEAIICPFGKERAA